MEGRRSAVPDLQRVAAVGGERSRVAAARHARDRAGATQVPFVRDSRRREAHRLRHGRGRSGPSLRSATAKVNRASRSQGDFGGGQGGGDPWQTAPQGGGQSAPQGGGGDPWGGGAQGGQGGGGGSYEEPPF